MLIFEPLRCMAGNSLTFGRFSQTTRALSGRPYSVVPSISPVQSPRPDLREPYNWKMRR